MIKNKKFNIDQNYLKIRELIVSHTHGYDIWDDLINENIKNDILTPIEINTFIKKSNLKCSTNLKNCKCLYCYFQFFKEQKKGSKCTKPIKKETLNKCFCYYCNYNRLVSYIGTYEIIKNPYYVYNIPLELAKKIADFLKMDDTNVNMFLSNLNRLCYEKSSEFIFHEKYKQKNYERDIGINFVSNKTYDYETYNLVHVNNVLMIKKNYYIEQFVSNFINNSLIVHYDKDEEYIINMVKRQCLHFKYEINDDLINCSINSLLSPISIISGEAGCGKSTCIQILQKILELNHLKSAGLAFTGKAVDKLKSKLYYSEDILEIKPDINLMTIHSYLLSDLDFDVLIIDEASMISTKLIYKLFKKLSLTGKKYQIILFGDNNQLPPIEWGKFFKELEKCEHIVKTKLTLNFRTKSESRVIINNAKLFMESNNTNTSIDLSQPEYFELIYGNEKEFMNWIKDFYNTDGKYDLNKIKNNQIICPVSSYDGCELINAKYQKMYCNTVNISYTFAGKYYKWFLYDKVICIKNYKNIISNGTDGIIIGIKTSFITLYPQKGGYFVYKIEKDNYGRIIYKKKLDKINPKNVSCYIEILTLSIQTLFGIVDVPIMHTKNNRLLTIQFFNLAYAITTHKSQGSEYEHVCYFLSDSSVPSKSNTYTALTRSKKKCTVFEIKNKENKFLNSINTESPKSNDQLSNYIEKQNIQFKKITELKFKSILLSNKYVTRNFFQSSTTKMKIICNNDHIFYLSPYDLCILNKKCKFCSKNVSKAELEFVNYCNKNKLDYVSEYPSPWSPGHRYDFLVKEKNKQYIVELDGKQHFEYTPFFHKTHEIYEYWQNIDILKTKECIDNDILIVRIDYKSNIHNTMDNIRNMINSDDGSSIYVSNVNIYDFIIQNIF
jgi:energy-coupling factor transporter ATP-binding protein EcfA2